MEREIKESIISIDRSLKCILDILSGYTNSCRRNPLDDLRGGIRQDMQELIGEKQSE